jgi:hypothetical protein
VKRRTVTPPSVIGRARQPSEPRPQAHPFRFMMCEIGHVYASFPEFFLSITDYAHWAALKVSADLVDETGGARIGVVPEVPDVLVVL